MAKRELKTLESDFDKLLNDLFKTKDKKEVKLYGKHAEQYIKARDKMISNE